MSKDVSCKKTLIPGTNLKGLNYASEVIGKMSITKSRPSVFGREKM